MKKVLLLLPILLIGCVEGERAYKPTDKDYTCTREQQDLMEREIGLCLGPGVQMNVSLESHKQCFSQAKQTACTLNLPEGARLYIPPGDDGTTIQEEITVELDPETVKLEEERVEAVKEMKERGLVIQE